MCAFIYSSPEGSRESNGHNLIIEFNGLFNGVKTFGILEQEDTFLVIEKW